MNFSKSHTKRPLISLTPLIDVVFILLIFFMLASSFTEWEFIKLGLGEPESLPNVAKSQSLITVDFEARYTLNGEKLSLETIAHKINEQVRLQGDHPVLIKPVDDLPLQQIVTILDRIGEMAGANISLVKDERKGEH